MTRQGKSAGRADKAIAATTNLERDLVRDDDDLRQHHPVNGLATREAGMPRLPCTS
jgi:hypothetical protein